MAGNGTRSATGVLQTEGDPRGRDVVGERPQQDQQVMTDHF